MFKSPAWIVFWSFTIIICILFVGVSVALDFILLHASLGLK